MKQAKLAPKLLQPPAASARPSASVVSVNSVLGSFMLLAVGVQTLVAGS